MRASRSSCRRATRASARASPSIATSGRATCASPVPTSGRRPATCASSRRAACTRAWSALSIGTSQAFRPAPHASRPRPRATERTMDRRPLYIGDGNGACFGWIHEDPQAAARDTVAVICAPGGYEYTRAHRTLRHLADRFARAGIPALRFDYHGTGNSAGDDFEPDRLATWIGNVAEAVASARKATGCDRVYLVGVRLGATLAALASRQVSVDDLVLWNPAVSGKGYVREMQAIAMSVEGAEQHADGLL